MTSRAVEDHVLLAADAFSKMNQKKTHKKHKKTEMPRKSLVTDLRQGTFPYCVTEEAITYGKIKKTPKL